MLDNACFADQTHHPLHRAGQARLASVCCGITAGVISASLPWPFVCCKRKANDRMACWSCLLHASFSMRSGGIGAYWLDDQVRPRSERRMCKLSSDSLSRQRSAWNWVCARRRVNERAGQGLFRLLVGSGGGGWRLVGVGARPSRRIFTIH